MTQNQSSSLNSRFGATVYIGLGANLDNPFQQVMTAFEKLDNLRDSSLIARSGLYQSSPMGPQDQADYINAVACLSTNLSPLELLDELQTIENGHGRIRTGDRWGPRTLDLDLLLYNNQHIEHSRLTVPHYGMRQRNFVLLPLAEIAPLLTLPDGTPLQLLLENIDQQGIKRL